MKSVTFQICLRLFNEILCHIHTLHKFLQSSNATLGDASTQIIATLNYIKSLRNETEWSRIVNNIDFNEISRKRHINTNFNDFVVNSTIGQRDSPSEIDCVINEFESRFSENALSVAKSVGSILRLEDFNMNSLFEYYSNILTSNKDLLISEFKIASNEFKTFGLPVSDIITKEKYPQLYTLYCICLTLPVSSSTCERSFSVLRRIHNYLRTTMSDTRLSDLSLLCIEKEFFKTIPISSFMDEFISKPRRLKFH